MSGRKRSGNATPNYLIGMDKNNLDKKHASFLGKLRGNSDKNEWSIYDTGENPSKFLYYYYFFWFLIR